MFHVVPRDKNWIYIKLETFYFILPPHLIRKTLRNWAEINFVYGRPWYPQAYINRLYDIYSHWYLWINSNLSCIMIYEFLSLFIHYILEKVIIIFLQLEISLSPYIFSQFFHFIIFSFIVILNLLLFIIGYISDISPYSKLILIYLVLWYAFLFIYYIFVK